MKFNRFFALSLIACVSLTSCLKSEYRYSGYVTFADVVDGTHLNGDADRQYVITENAADGDLMEVESKRIIMNCDLLDANVPQSIKLNLFRPVAVKQCLRSDSVTEEQTSHADSLYIAQRYLAQNGENWYLTLVLSVPKLKDSKTEHELELVYDVASTSSKIVMTLYHDADGDVFTKETKDEDKSSEVVYISFPVKSLFQDIFTNGTEIDLATAHDRKKAEQKKDQE